MPFANEDPQPVGRHYTPAVIARLAVAETLRLLQESPGSVFRLRELCALDPACGEGVFLVELLRALIRDSPEDISPEVFANGTLCGIDRDGAAVRRCRQRLVNAVSNLSADQAFVEEELQQALDTCILHGDAMTGPGFRPPEVLAKDKSRTRSRRRRSKTGTPDSALVMPFPAPPIDFAAAFPQAARDGGFDLVVGNPPYLRERNARGLFDIVLDSPLGQRWSQPRMDFWHFFLHRGLDVLRPGGILTFLVSGYWTAAHSAVRLIERLQQETTLRQIVDFGNAKLFPGVSGRHMLIWLQKENSNHPCRVIDLSPLKRKIEAAAAADHRADKSRDETTADECLTWLTDRKAEQREIPSHQLYQDGRLVLRPASARDIGRLSDIRLDEHFEVRQGIAENPAVISTRLNRQFDQRYRVGEGVLVLSPEEVERLEFSPAERELLRPYVKAADIKRYSVPNSPTQWLLYLTRETAPSLERFPQVHRHLERFRPILERRREVAQNRIAWWYLHWPREERIFTEPRLFGVQMSLVPTFARAVQPLYTGFSVNVILPSRETPYTLPAVQGLLNSRRAVEWFDRLAKRRGVNLDISGGLLRRFPLPAPDTELLPELDPLALERETQTGKAAERREIQREQIVNRLYGQS